MELSRHIFVWVFPLLLLAALLEAGYLQWVKKNQYDWRESLSSLVVALGGRVIGVMTAGLVLGISAWATRHHTLQMTQQDWYYWPSLLLAEEFLYYCFHRASHTMRWFWATHAVHHSPNHFYLSGAYRLGWTGQITGSFLFFTPLLLIGYAPRHVGMVLSVNLIYQFWLHTELVGRLGWFDRVFNSPSNHRVHHATEAQYLNKNFGGVVMLFDHIFGTYVAEPNRQPVTKFGVIPGLHSRNPIVIALHEWRNLYCAVSIQPTFYRKCKTLFGAP